MSLALDWIDGQGWSDPSTQSLNERFADQLHAQLAMAGFQVDRHSPRFFDQHAPWQVQTTDSKPMLLHVVAQQHPRTLAFDADFLHPDSHCHVVVGWPQLRNSGKRPLRALWLPSTQFMPTAGLAQTLHGYRHGNGQNHDTESLEALHQEAQALQRVLPSHAMVLQLNEPRFKQLTGEGWDAMRYLIPELQDPNLAPLLTPQFLHTVFSDRFLFNDTAGRREHVQANPLNPDQLKLAKEIRKSQLYTSENMEQIYRTCNELDDLFNWCSNSEGPFIFTAHILYLLRRLNKDTRWFRAVWKRHPQWRQI